MNSDFILCLIYKTGMSSLELDKIISKNDNYSYEYAMRILKNRFELGEEAISKDEFCSLYYAKNVLKDRFELGEWAISKNGFYSLGYAMNVLNGRFKLGEKTISKYTNFNYCCEYCIHVLEYNHE